MNASELFVRCLEAEGVTHIFGIPGEENLAFLEALRTSSIKLVLTRHEQAAGFMAATFGRLTGKPGVCLSTLGPGATNFVTAASYALLGGMPMVLITGQKPIKKSKQGRFQILDVVGVMEPVTKLARQVVSGNAIPALVRDAFRVAQEEKPGPVHLELPEDIAEEVVSLSPLTVAGPYIPQADRAAVVKAVELIRKAERPLLTIAAGANRHSVCEAVEGFVDVTGIYFFSTQMGKGVVDQRHPQSLGSAALSDHDYLHCAIARADLIINVGHDVVEKPPFFMEPDDGKTVIHINYSAAQVDQVYFPQHEVVGDIAESLYSLTEALGDCRRPSYEYFTRIKQEVERNVYGNGQAADTFPPTPQRIVLDMREAMPDDGVLSLDNGMYKIWFARNYKAYRPNSLLLDNALATMGAGLPVAIAAKLLHPEQTVVALCGDGGFMMNSQELETALRLRLDLVVVVLRDDGYGMIKWKQAGMGLAVYGLDFGNPDFVAYAKSYGARGHRITRSGEFGEVLRACFSEGGVHVIELPVDYSENERVLLQELRSKTCLL